VRVAGSIFDAYVSGAAGAFYPAHFSTPSDRRRAVRRAAARPLTSAVAAALEAQNAGALACPARRAHLTALRDGAAAVVTGQQLGLFLGPLFTVYKAASAIRVARALSAETGEPVVPVFWLQSEDHDVPEIAVGHVPCATGGLRALAVEPAAGERISVAHRGLPNDVTACLAALGVELAHLPHAAPHLERLARHYRPGGAWSAAFAGVLGELFADEGLLLIDPRDPALARAAAPVHRRALAEAESIAAALVDRSRALAAAGFTPPVHVRPGAPLSFFHPDGPHGPRYRLTPADADFALIGRDGRCARAALLAALEAEPLRFSTSALLRPILQDSLLPTAAYVGGPAEVAYLAQLPPLYAAYELDMPLVVPRARLRVIEEHTARLLARLGLTADDARRPAAELLAAADVRGARDAAALADRVLAGFSDSLAAMRAAVEPLGPGVSTAFEKTRATVAAAVRKLVGKVEHARLNAERDTVAAVHRLKQSLWPHDAPQERVYLLAYFAARFGERAFLERVLDAVEPFDARPRDLIWADEAAGR
jgi:bacillithiol biosynthesis cysteine-adding enzyme BshC